MGSVIATWKGRCPERDIQNELLSFLRLLAERQEAQWAEMPLPRPGFSDLLAAHRAKAWPALPVVRRIDQVLQGRIAVCSDVADDPHALVEAATDHGLKQKPLASGRYAVLHLERLHVRGLDFRLFDPRELYPGEDRMGFFFLHSEEAPFLNGWLAAVSEREVCALSTDAAVREADWYIEGPYVHLRYYLEDWLDRLMAWIKFFFLPGLQYQRYEPHPAYPQHRATLHALHEQMGYPQARIHVFDDLLADFDEEAGRWKTHLADMAERPNVEGLRLVVPEWDLLFHDETTRVWQDANGDGLSLHVHTSPPDLPASLEDIDAVRSAIRTAARQIGAGLVEVDVVTLDGLPAVRSIVKKPQQPSGMTYQGTLLLPWRDFSFEVRVLCRETGITGMRDSAVYLRWATQQEHETPGGMAEGWFQDPYDPAAAGPALRNPSDDPVWDNRFPDHPLSRCRAHLQMLTERISLKDDVKAAAAFVGPSRGK